ncbi:glycosyltransferase [Kocuria sp. SM24M-10]|uniref:glycosyltransferase n=1 Tax=Kocuria sp. SM24M-10 TaxID=1660349 RepID=UPI00064B502F|nr:glycosyltransferase [Kocuria sp. SM24M-10]KLU11073.1 glycosyl transferase family protein [Kocuria sp. SM24M-10]
MASPLHIVAVVPCHNEEAAIAKVVTDLHATIPGIEVHVYDNCSTDGTAEAARRAGASVRREEEKGKGNVVRRAFADLEADVYLLIDGDDTYDVADAPRMIATLLAGPYDHVLGVRRQISGTAYRAGHESGNRFFNTLVTFAFRRQVTDMLSGYRVFSRRFVKSFPALSREFEIETELTVHSVNARVPQTEVEVGFRDRADGSESKLRTYHDGFRILGIFVQLLFHERPFLVAGAASFVLFVLGLVLGLPVVVEFAGTGLVPRFPTAFLAASLVVLAGVFLLMGVLLHGQAKIRRETSRLFYLRLPAPPWSGGAAADHPVPPTAQRRRWAR